MISRKIYSEFAGRESASLHWIYFLDDKPLVQLQIFAGDGPFNHNRNRREGRYTIFWRTEKISIADMRLFEQTIIDSYFPNRPKASLSLSDPVRIHAMYFYSDNQNVGHQKRFFSFLPLGTADTFDKYDSELQRIHDEFVAENESRISYARHDVGAIFGLVFSV